MTRDRDDHYVLDGGRRGAARLKLLARVKWPTTRTLLRQVGLQSGMRCLDVGCGIGAVTLKLARRVGPTGLAVGIDRDDACLELARQAASRDGLPAVFRNEPVSDLRQDAAYDFVYSRFLLTHLSQPGLAVESMVQAARPGGVVAVEDIEFAAHFSHPRCVALDRYVTLYQEVVKRKGGDANIGPSLVGLLMTAGLEEVHVEVVQPTYRSGLGKRIAQVTMEHIKEAVVGEGLASVQEVDSIVADLDRYAADESTIVSLPRIFQVWGRRAAAQGSG